MEFVTVLGISFGLAMDAFAVAIGASATIKTVTGRQYFRLSFHFGFFQFLMPIIGYLLGSTFAWLVASFDHWVAFGLLAVIGVRMIAGAVWEKEVPAAGSPRDPTRGWSLVLLSVATSIDALAVGVSFAMLKSGIVLPCVTIGLVAAGLTFVGMRLGGRLGARFGSRMEVLGGVILIFIGSRILVQHLAG